MSSATITTGIIILGCVLVGLYFLDTIIKLIRYRPWTVIGTVGVLLILFGYFGMPYLMK